MIPRICDARNAGGDRFRTPTYEALPLFGVDPRGASGRVLIVRQCGPDQSVFARALYVIKEIHRRGA